MKKKKTIKKTSTVPSKKKAPIDDLYEMWKGADIYLEKLREEAWSRRQEGPTTITITETKCSGCKYHTQQIMRTGRNPIYNHYCEHPDSLSHATERDTLDGTHKAWIGEEDKTPNWCPFIKK